MPRVPSPRVPSPHVIGGVALAGLGLVAVVNSVGAESLPIWRQLLFGALAPVAYLHGRHVVAGRGGWVLAGVALLATPLALVTPGTVGTAMVMLAVFVVAPWLAGRNRRQQAELARAAVERVAQLEREQELVAQRAQALERARIAADLHDHVGHDLALIAVQAGALEVSTELDPRARAAAAGIRAGAVKATDRLRTTLGALRAASVTAGSTVPLDASVTAVVARAASAGLDVRLEGDPESTSDTVGELPGQAARRVVQEALTNAAKHAPGATVTVRVRRDAGAVLVDVTSGRATDASGSGKAVTGTGTRSAVGGSGLIALAERVRLLDGTFSAGPEDGGFVVRARIPAGAAAETT